VVRHSSVYADEERVYLVSRDLIHLTFVFLRRCVSNGRVKKRRPVFSLVRIVRNVRNNRRASIAETRR
jgi:hypothetical protein